MSDRRPAAILRAASVVALAAACTVEVASGATDGRTNDQELVIADPAAGDIYGAAVALCGDLAVVACEYDDDAGIDSGSVYVFRDDGERWVMEQKLLPRDGQAGDNFGRSVAVQGDRIVVGAHWDDDLGSMSGSVYVFRHDGTRWRQEQKLLAADGRAQDRFGVSVSLHGDVLGIGAWLRDGVSRDLGAVYVFRHDGTRWKQEQVLVDAGGEQGDNFGRSVSVSGNRILVGAWKDDGAGADAGAAYVFRHDGARWKQEQELKAGDGAEGDLFGWCVWLDGAVALIGAYKADARAIDSGAAYLFRLDGERWVQGQKLVADDGGGGDWFAYSTALSGDMALIGAHQASTQRGRTGAAYVFRRENERWVQTRRLVASKGAPGDSFGFQVSAHEGRALVGAWRTAQAGKETGSAYGYRDP